MLYASELTWNGEVGVEGEHQRAINRMGRATLGVFRSTPLGIVETESGHTPARALLPAIQGGSTPDPKVERALRSSQHGRTRPPLRASGRWPPFACAIQSRPRSGVPGGLSLVSLSWTIEPTLYRWHKNGGAGTRRGPTAPDSTTEE